MNWIIKFDQLDKENTDKTLDIIVKFHKYKNDRLDDVYTKAYNLKYSIDNLIDKLNAHAIVGEELSLEVGKLIQTHIEIKDEYENQMTEIIKYVYVCGNEAVKLKNTMFENTSRYVRSNKDADMFYKRMDVFSEKLANMSIALQMGFIDETGIFVEVYESLMTIKKIIETKNRQYDDEEYELIEQLKQNQKKDYFKIFDYKEMIGFAEQNEYKQVRQSGDHIIMQHNKSNKIVPIPAHELKYGLMLQIQKQIETNKIS